MRHDGALAMQPDQALHGNREYKLDHAPGLKGALHTGNEHPASGKVEGTAAETDSIDIDIDIGSDFASSRVTPLLLHKVKNSRFAGLC